MLKIRNDFGVKNLPSTRGRKPTASKPPPRANTFKKHISRAIFTMTTGCTNCYGVYAPADSPGVRAGENDYAMRVLPRVSGRFSEPRPYAESRRNRAERRIMPIT